MKKNKNVKGRVFVILMMMLGAAISVIAVLDLLQGIVFVSTALKTIGPVEAVQAGSGFPGNLMVCPMVEFTTQNGVPIIFVSKTGAFLRSSAYKAGDIVDILYAPQDPFDVRINAFSQIWIRPVVLLVFSLLFLLGPFLLYPFSILWRR